MAWQAQRFAGTAACCASQKVTAPEFPVAPREGWLDGPFHLPIVANKFKVNIVLHVVASRVPCTEIHRRNKSDSTAKESSIDVL
jgi:hypothetical protein